MSQLACRIEPFDSSRVAMGRLFGDALEEHPWVLFHGTSACASSRIESQGLFYPAHCVSASDIRAVVRVFDDIRWAGNDLGGYVVLKAFCTNDFAAADISPVFLAESSVRALRFATRDFAGGEKLRAIRRAMRDLERYLNEEDIRAEHIASLTRSFNSLTRVGARPDHIESVRPRTVDLGWLSQQVLVLQRLAAVAAQPFDTFEGGVVYALRIEPKDLHELTYDSTMGVKAWKPIPPRRIVSKISVNAEFVYEDLAAARDLGLHLLRLNAGVLGELRQLQKT